MRLHRKQTDEIIGTLRRWLPLGMACSLPQLLRAENHVDYRYEYYGEENDRMKIETHSVYFEQQMIDSVIAKGELIYDGISGATPKGTYEGSPDSGMPTLVQLHDTRRAFNLELDTKLGRHTLTPGFAYSSESDYTSYGISLTDEIAFNDKNTLVRIGGAHNFDWVLDNSNPRNNRDKGSTDFLIGITQLLTPKTVLSADFTYGYESGYLTDPYRRAEFVYPRRLLGVSRFEIRPDHRDKEIIALSLTQFFESVDASLEGSYRFYHDSFGVDAHTLALTWHQWLGKHLMVEPTFRFYEQSAASFYSPLFHVDPNTLEFYSADYRLSQFYSLTYGVQATVMVNDHLHIVAGYHRYEMRGLDDTPRGTYPQANIFTVGISILW